MSDAPSTPALGDQPKKPSKAVSIAILVFAAIAIIGGISRMTSELSEFFGGLDPKVKQLLEESDAAGAKGLEVARAGDEKFNALIESVNGKLLEELRKDETAVVDEARKSLAEAAEHFRAAGKKIDEALGLKVEGKIKEYMLLKSAMYASYAEAYDRKVEVIAAIVDETIKDRDALIAKMNEISAKADAAFKAGNESSVKADSLAKGETPKAADTAKDGKESK